YFNLGSIIGGVGIGWWLDPHFGARSLTGLAVGTLIGGMWQLTAQFPSLRRVGYKYRADFQWRDQGVRAVLILIAPATIAASGMRLAFLLTIPSAIGLAMLASPIISVIYQHGRFTAEMTRQTGGALQFYAIGLVAYSALKVLTTAFYAIGKRNTPMIVSFFAIGTSL